MRRLGTLLVSGGVGLLFGCGNPAAVDAGRSTQIAATDFEFAPATDTVAPNQNISFLFPATDTATHDVTWINPPPGYSAGDSSGGRRPGSLPYTIYIGTDTNKTYSYYCNRHGSPDGSGMAGTIYVTTH
jgi:plastocyanin